MHEYSLVQALLDLVEKQARAHHASAVHRVTVRIGDAGGVEPSLLATAFEMSRPGTLCECAELELKTEETRWVCDCCGGRIETGRRLACPLCGWPARMAGGDALVLERVELEVPNV
ncbi:MAG TPA: hydrogenase maturation nickel metallochaperone HypA [Candidatus Binatia bacterium]|jgi:hydrogenase nickel incorporation protein HypA/HybF